MFAYIFASKNTKNKAFQRGSSFCNSSRPYLQLLKIVSTSSTLTNAFGAKHHSLLSIIALAKTDSATSFPS